MEAEENNVVVESINMEIPLTDQDHIVYKEEFPSSNDPMQHHQTQQDHQQHHQQEQTFRQQQAYIYVCELCNDSFSQQLKFFEHLKAHYGSGGEGGGGGGGIEGNQDNLVEIQNDHVQTKFEVVASSTEHDGEGISLSSTLTYNMDPSNNNTKDAHGSLKKPDDVQSVIAAVDESMKITVATTTATTMSTITAPAKVLLPCPKCKKTFRREKTFQNHMENCHKEIIEPDDETLVYETVKTKPKGRGKGRTNKQQQQIILEQIVEESPPVDDDDVQAGLVQSSMSTMEVVSDPLAQEEVMFDDDGFLVEAETIEEVGEEDEDEMEEDENEDEDGLFSEDGHPCIYCDEAFPTKGRLTTHLKTFHAEELPLTTSLSKTPTASNSKGKRATGQKKSDVLKCTQCQRIFNHRNSLVYHMRSHTGERPHQCELCGKSFFATSALKVHMRLHSGEKPYKCENCGRNFRQWGDLKYHMISIHSDIRQYQCEFCGKDFARKYSLIVHRRIHTGERNYKCEYCSKCFRAASYLQNHRRIHTGEKPHSCAICGKPFRVRSDMKRHMASHSREHNNHNSSNVTVQQQQQQQQQQPQITPTVQNVVTVSSINNSNQQIITIGPQISQQIAQAVRNGTIQHATVVAASPSNSSVIPTSVSDSTGTTNELQRQQITINDNEVVITGDIGEGGTPINITLAPETSLANGVVTTQEGVLFQQNREGNLETVTIRESNTGTLYVWPVFMN